MHIEHIISQLHQMKLSSMAQSLKTRMEAMEYKQLSHIEFIALLVEDEFYARKNRRMKQMIGKANFKPELPTIEDLIYEASRGVSKQDITPFTSQEWLKKSLNVIITGPTGCGKTYLAEAIAHQACRMDFEALKIRYSLLLEELHAAKGTGTYLKYLKKIAKVKVLLIDDFLMQNSTTEEVAWLMDVIEEKQQTGSIIVTTQYPVNLWHKKLPDPTIADALCDRLIHTAYKFQLKGNDSMRKLKKELK
jgi:DNA replication protein DnaC